jgi:formylglycine-generating enzyme required for sulfatase activity
LERLGTLTKVSLVSPEANITYTIERTTNLVSGVWIPLKTLNGSNASAGFAITPTNRVGFLRAIAGPAIPSGSTMVFIPPGFFLMGDPYSEGSSSERPIHAVFVSGFWVDRYEVSNERVRSVFQWAYDHGRLFTTDFRVIKSTEGSKPVLLDLHRDDYATSTTRYWSGITFTNGLFATVDGRENQPCIDISWAGAAAYCNYQSEMEGLEPCFDLSATNYVCDFTRSGYRLPTEAEWEKAARGGMSGQHYPWPSEGGSFSAFINQGYANYTPPTQPHPFNMKAIGYYDGQQVPSGPDMANGYGLYDVAGNAREWCYDWYQADWYSQPGASLPDPAGPLTGTNRCQRGGSFDLGPAALRVAARDSQAPVWPTAASWYNGFRTVRRP